MHHVAVPRYVHINRHVSDMKIYKCYLESFETATFFSVSHYSQVCILHTCVYIYISTIINFWNKISSSKQ